MSNKELAEMIFDALQAEGAGLGNASISIIESTLDEIDNNESFDIDGEWAHEIYIDGLRDSQ